MLLSLMSLAAAAAPTEVAYSIEPLVAIDLKHTGTEDTAEAWTWLQAKASQRNERGRWFIAVQADHHLRSGADTEAIWTTRIGETGWAGAVGPTHVRLGVLLERWGKLDLLPTLNVLNPADLRAGPLSTLEASRIATPMAVVQLGSDSLRLEASYAPFPSPDLVSLQGTDWSLIKPGVLERAFEEIPSYQGADNPLLSETIQGLADSLASLDASTQRGFTSALTQTNRPDDTGLQGNAGLRLEWEGEGVDLAVMGANLQSPTPLTRLAPAYRDILEQRSLPSLDQFSTLASTEPLQTSWPRTWLAGAELSTVIGPLGLRTESSWWSAKVVPQQWLGGVIRPTTAHGIGLDYAHGSSIYVTLETRWTHLLDDVVQPYLTRTDVLESGILARIGLFGDRLHLHAAGLLNWTFSSWLARPELRYTASDALSVGIGAVLIDAEAPTPASLQEVLSHPAGPLSLVQDNDALFVTMRWTQ